MMKRRKRIALLIETSNSYARGLLDGIIAYVREHESWSIFLPEFRRGDPPPAWLGRWRGDGIIARVENREIARAVARARLPIVDVSAARMMPAVPWVETDDAAIARAAADHLLERNFRHLAFCGDPRFNWSNWRCEHFGKIAEQSGATVSVHQATAANSWDRERRRLDDWIRRLPRPVGIMACYDIMGQQILDACRDGGVAVPEEIAVLGVDDDPLICELCEPPLSSVIPNTRRTGYLAADILDQMIGGHEPPSRANLIEPLGVRTRRSTDILAVEDRDVAAALRVIRERACEGIRVSELLRVVPLSRRILEHRFLKCLGRTPHEEIERVKIEHVKRLLRDTELPLSVIARRAGFSSDCYLSVAFKRAVRQTPRDYRRAIPKPPSLSAGWR